MTPPVPSRLHHLRTGDPQKQGTHPHPPISQPGPLSGDPERIQKSCIIEESEIDKGGYVNGIDAPRLYRPYGPVAKESGSITTPPRSHPSQVLSQEFGQTPFVVADPCFNVPTINILPGSLQAVIDHPPRDEIIIVCIQWSYESEEYRFIGKFSEKIWRIDNISPQCECSARYDKASTVDGGSGPKIEVMLFEVEAAEDVAKSC